MTKPPRGPAEVPPCQRPKVAARDRTKGRRATATGSARGAARRSRSASAGSRPSAAWPGAGTSGGGRSSSRWSSPRPPTTWCG
jgi:hypothetical protein